MGFASKEHVHVYVPAVAHEEPDGGSVDGETEVDELAALRRYSGQIGLFNSPKRAPADMYKRVQCLAALVVASQ